MYENLPATSDRSARRVQRNDLQRELASNKSYLTEAVITFIAYAVFWLPGLIINVLFLKDARKTEEIAGHSLPGVGCLQILLFFNIGLPAILCGLALLSSVLSTAAR